MPDKHASSASSRSAGRPGGRDAPRATETKDGLRETVESIVIAFVLAFLFRTFEAEAFVIPTGSMAPTLLGQHKDLECPKCGFTYQVSCSHESPPDEITDPRIRANWSQNHRLISSVCPNCRYEIDFDSIGYGPTSYRGDRILVGKLPLEFAPPRRWDVTVFKYPGEAKVNYIKRLVGLPNETLRITHGDIFTKPNPSDGVEFTIERKPPQKVQAVLQVVFDNQYQAPGMPPRWRSLDSAADDAWQELHDGRGFKTNGDDAEDHWLVYEHRVPDPEAWRSDNGLEGNPTGSGAALSAPPQLITDCYGYNTGVNEESGRPDQNYDRLGLNWVGDLAVDCRLHVERAEGEALLALVEGGRIFQCRIDLATGLATFRISGESDWERSVKTPVRSPGDYQVQLANVDDQLLLWVDGKSLDFDGAYDSAALGNRRPTVDDLRPVRLGSRGAAIRFDRLRVLRDLYYIADSSMDPHHTAVSLISETGNYAERNSEFFSDSSRWDELADSRAIDFALGPDEFFMLGDNSPRSKDSRLWDGHSGGRHEYFVRRELLIGKALYIYWPHALDHLPATKIWFPLFPNFGRMGFVR